ncbi:MAG: bifunctional phosphoglucose/phosphomannose isomerase [Fidelibacterota bacterium]
MDIKSIDTQNMRKAIFDFPAHLIDALTIGRNFTPKNIFQDIQNIVVAGMGGSAIGGDVCRLLVSNDLTVPLVVCRNYTLPNWVNKHTLVICSSYSGNTEESLSAFENGQEKGAMLCGISTGGILTEKMQAIGLDVISIPAGLQPRAALAYSVVPMLFHLINQRLINDSILDDIQNAAEMLMGKREGYRTENRQNPTYQLASKIFDTIPIIYGSSETTAIVALRLKGQFCENADMLAYHNELPEMNHNEIVGWENNSDVFNHFSVLWIKDEKDHPRVQLRQEITRQIIEGKNTNQHIIRVEGSTPNSRFLHLIHFGDWVSYWCAIFHDTNPSPVKPIMRLKNKLSEKE